MFPEEKLSRRQARRRIGKPARRPCGGFPEALPARKPGGMTSPEEKPA